MEKAKPHGTHANLEQRLAQLGSGGGYLNETEIKDRVAVVEEFFNQLLRSLKNISIYRHNTARFGEYLENPFRILGSILEKFDTIPFKVDQLGFSFLDQTVYQEDASDQNIAHKFYRDGVRFLIFRKGMPLEELLDFVMICLTNFRTPEFLNDDMVSLLWKREFEFIEYVVVESFAVGTEAQEQAKAEIDQIVNFLYQRMTSQSKDSIHFARLSFEDLDIELDEVEQAKGLTIKGAPATLQDKLEIKKQLEEDEDSRMLPKLVVILLKVLEEPLDDKLAETLQLVFIQLLDSFLIHEDFRSINQVLRRFRSLQSHPLEPGNLGYIDKMEKQFLAKMGEEERIERIGKILDSSAFIKYPQEVFRYFTVLGTGIIEPMLRTIEGMERIEARRLLCDALIVLGQDQVPVFEKRLQSTKSNMVRDMLYIIDAINPPEKLKIISHLLAHPNLVIRLEALETLGAGAEESCRSYVLSALSDENSQMRIKAAKLLPNFNITLATETLLRLIQAPDFEEKPPAEQQAFFSALAMTNSTEAIDFFSRQLRSSKVLSRKKLQEHKKNIIQGLAQSESIAAYKFLKSELESGIKEPEIQALVEKASRRLKAKLLGS